MYTQPTHIRNFFITSTKISNLQRTEFEIISLSSLFMNYVILSRVELFKTYYLIRTQHT